MKRPLRNRHPRPPRLLSTGEGGISLSRYGAPDDEDVQTRRSRAVFLASCLHVPGSAVAERHPGNEALAAVATGACRSNSLPHEGPDRLGRQQLWHANCFSCHDRGFRHYRRWITHQELCGLSLRVAFRNSDLRTRSPRPSGPGANYCLNPLQIGIVDPHRPSSAPGSLSRGLFGCARLSVRTSELATIIRRRPGDAIAHVGSPRQHRVKLHCCTRV